MTQATKINSTFVKSIKPPQFHKGDKAQLVYIDTLERGLALMLVVSYGGTKSFRALTYVNGKPKTRKLGTYPAMSVQQARKEARTYWESPKKFEEKAETGTFKDVAQKWIKRHVDENKLRSKPEIERMLKIYVYPKWGSQKFLEIRRLQVNELLDYVVDNHGRSQADAVLAVIRNICNWYEGRSEHYEFARRCQNETGPTQAGGSGPQPLPQRQRNQIGVGGRRPMRAIRCARQVGAADGTTPWPLR